MATRIKDLREMVLAFQDGFTGSSAINDTPVVSDTTLGVDTHVLRDSRTVVPVGARFTTAGIATVRTVTATQNSAQYTLDLDSASGGTFTVTHSGNTTSALAYNLTDTALQSALEGLASVGAGNVAVTEAANVYTITFQGDLANTTQTITVDGGSLTAADSETLTQVQTGLVTWEVTFTPAIATGFVPSDDDAITWYPRRLTFEPETGDLAWTESDAPIVRKSRGTINGLRLGVEQEMTVNSAFEFSKMRAASTSTTATTPYEVLNQLGVAADWLPSSHGGVCEPYSVDLVVWDRPACGSEEAEVIIFPQFAKTEVSPSVQDGIITFSGVCAAVKPIVTSVANTDDAIGIIY